MLDLVNKLLQRILLDGVDALASNQQTSEQQVTFVAPDEDWKGSALVGKRPRLSAYLVDLRENVKLRSNDRIERRDGAQFYERKLPYRLDCHYLINAYAAPGQPYDAPLTHTLLYQATRALVASQPLVPARFYAAGSSELSAWGEFGDIELPLVINPHEGFFKLPEFWGTLANTHPWQPPVYIIVTVPVTRDEAAGRGVVRRAVAIYKPGVKSETRQLIGGLVIDRTTKLGVGRAVVIVLNGQVELARTASADDGTFVLELPEGASDIYAAAFGRGVSTKSPITDQTTDFTLELS